MNQKLKVAVIGVGHLGSYHAGKYNAIDSVELVGVADTDFTRAKVIAGQQGTEAYRNYEDILNKVDAVSIAVPTEAHHEVAEKVLKSGVHVLIEKPITYDLERADRLIDLANEKKLVLQVGLIERFNPAIVKMQELLDCPYLLESHRMNLFTTRGTDVDVVLDLMIHDLDIILHSVQSEVKELHAVGMSIITDKTDIANARLIFENGTVANLTASRISNEMLRKIRVFQPGAYISANCGKKKLTLVRLDKAVIDSDHFPELTSNKTNFPDSDALADEIMSFINAVKNGSGPVVSGEDGRRALKYALEIINQIKQGSKKFHSIC
ncbi:Gfo/Idh/MocA family protein [Thermodesulfobacteriota bacterium]